MFPVIFLIYFLSTNYSNINNSNVSRIVSKLLICREPTTIPFLPSTFYKVIRGWVNRMDWDLSCNEKSFITKMRKIRMFSFNVQHTNTRLLSPSLTFSRLFFIGKFSWSEKLDVLVANKVGTKAEYFYSESWLQLNWQGCV